MEVHEHLLIIILGVAVVVGVVGSIAYYFARYGFRVSESGEPLDLPAQSPSLDLVEKKKDVVVETPTVAHKEVQLETALEKTKASFWGRLKGLLGGNTLPSELREQIEEVLYTSDLGVATVQRLMVVIDQLHGQDKANVERVRLALKNEMLKILNTQNAPELMKPSAQGKTISWLIVGVNGAGKTTTIGKLAYLLAQKGCRVLVAAGDTFRAAAEAQLKVWSERAQVEIFSPNGITDPAAVAYQAMEKAQAEKFDVVLIDTAGRLHTQKNLMEELKKVKRVMMKLDAQAPQETLLVLDANSGQNALVQAREFHQALQLSGVILTKMDGTAKGGVALSLAVELQLPLRLIGVGEQVTDLRPFQAQDYVDAII